MHKYLGSSVTAVKGRLHKARKQLRAKLLPLYVEDSAVVLTNQNTKPMIQVTVADLVFSPDHAPDGCITILWDEVNRRLLPIYVGIPSGEAIAQILTETSLPRPMTFQFISNMLKAANVSLESVRVETLQDNTFYAIVSLGCGDRTQEVDARPSDAIALALLMKSPIYVNETVMNEASVKI
jgi:bifunctional DNase/RNase